MILLSLFRSVLLVLFLTSLYYSSKYLYVVYYPGKLIRKVENIDNTAHSIEVHKDSQINQEDKETVKQKECEQEKSLGLAKENENINQEDNKQENDKK